MIKDNVIVFGEGDIVTFVDRCNDLVYFRFVEIKPPQEVGEKVAIEKVMDKNNKRITIYLRKEDIIKTINNLSKAINNEVGIIIKFNYIDKSFILDFSNYNKESMIIIKRRFESALNSFID